jgi:hypothetical protein
MLLRSTQILFATLFFFIHVACVQTPVERAERNHTQAQRDIAGAYQSLADKCRALLSYKPAQQFDFELFCKTRDQIADGQQLTLENWQTKTPEELMAIIEAFSLASFGSSRGLDESAIKTSHARLLKAQIVKLQKSKKNQDQKIRELVAFWYRLTHEQSAYKLLKNNAKSVEGLFVKISEEKRVERIEAELAKRGVIEAFESVGFISNTTYWQKFKNYLDKKRNEKNLAIATLFTIPAVIEANVWFAFFPVWDFAKVEKLTDRYQEIAFENGHEKAREMIRKESRVKGTFNTYAKYVSHAVNTIFMAGLIVTSVNSYQAQLEAQQEVIEMSTSSGTADEINQDYMSALAEKIIKEREEKFGRQLSEKEKNEIRNQFNMALTATNSKINGTK